MTDLRPCPFCGGRVHINHNIDFEPDGIYCHTCHMMVRYPLIEHNPKDVFGVTMEKLATAWNTRYTDDDLK